MRRLIVWVSLISIGAATPAVADDKRPLEGVRRVVFLGDSITYSGHYIEYIETYLRANDPNLRCEFINLGLPSETVSGLTEPGHAGGQFPRPVLSERIDRVLEKTKPDLIVVNYGMNDGIYYPYSDERFQKFRDGMIAVREKARAAGVKVLHVTPPVFDPVPIQARTLPAGRAEYAQPYEGYDDVLNLYSAWLLAQRGQGWEVVDAHGPMKSQLDRTRSLDPKFRFAADGVHVDADAHRIIARQILEHWGVPAKTLETATFSDTPKEADILKLVRQKQAILKDAWLTEVGHQRPGMNRGLPLAEARRKADEVEAEIVKPAK